MSAKKTRFLGLVGLAILGSALALAHTTNASASPAGYSFSDFTVTCTTHFNRANQRISGEITVGHPSVQTNATPVAVSWQPVLEKYYPGWGWYRDVVMNEMMGFAQKYGSLLPDAAPYPTGTAFTINVTNAYYRVRVYVRWYWNGQVFSSEWRDPSSHTSVSEWDRIADWGGYLVPVGTIVGGPGPQCYMPDTP